MPLQDLLNHIKGKDLTAEEKCKEAFIWVKTGDPRSLTYDDIKSFFAKIDQYAANEKKLLVRQKNKLTQEQAEHYKKEIGKIWLHRQTRPALSYDDYMKLSGANPETLRESAEAWQRKCKISANDFLHFIQTKMQDFADHHKLAFFNAWFERDGEDITERQLLDILQVEIKDIEKKDMKNALQTFFNRSGYQVPNDHQLLHLLVLYKIDDVLTMITINQNFDQLINIFKTNNNFPLKWAVEKRLSMIKSWLSVSDNKLNAEQTKVLIESNPEIIGKNRKEIISLNYQKYTNLEDKLNYLKSVIQLGLLDRLDSFEYIANQVGEILLGQGDNGLELASKFCQEVYQGVDVFKVAFFLYFAESHSVERGLGNKKRIFEDFLASISEDEDAILFVQYIEELYRLRPAETIELVKRRTSKQYQSLRGLLESRKVVDAVENEKISYLESFFGPEAKNMTLLDVFSYFNIQNDFDFRKFRDLLKQDVTEDMERTFKLPDNLCYLTSKEYDHLKHLVTNVELPKVEILAQQLNRKIKILTIHDHQIANFKINVAQGTYEENFDRLFESILRNNPQNLYEKDEQILSFLSQLLKKGEDYFDELGEARIKDFCKFFHQNKKGIAFMLKQEDGVEVVQNIFHAMQDGCAKNIASVFNTALIEYSIRKSQSYDVATVKALGVLFQFYIENIFTAQINRINSESGEFYVGNSDSPLNHEGILACHICAQGMIEKLNHKFQNPEKKYEFLCDVFMPQGGEDRLSKLTEVLNEDAELLFRFDYLISYAVLNQVVPDLANQLPELAQARSDFEKIRSEIILSDCENVDKIILLLKEGGSFFDKTPQEKSHLVISWLDKENISVSREDEKKFFEAEIFKMGSNEYKEVAKAFGLKIRGVKNMSAKSLADNVADKESII